MRSVFLVETSKRKLVLGRSLMYSLRVSNTTTVEAKRRQEYSEMFAAVNAGDITEQEWMDYCSMILQEIFAEEDEKELA
jgi:hypothetical protein